MLVVHGHFSFQGWLCYLFNIARFHEIYVLRYPAISDLLATQGSPPGARFASYLRFDRRENNPKCKVKINSFIQRHVQNLRPTDQLATNRPFRVYAPAESKILPRSADARPSVRDPPRYGRATIRRAQEGPWARLAQAERAKGERSHSKISLRRAGKSKIGSSGRLLFAAPMQKRFSATCK